MPLPPAMIAWAALLIAGDRAGAPRRLESIAMHEACYRSDLSEEQRRAILEWNGALPAAESAQGDERFVTQSSVWTGDLSLGNAGQAQATRLTYSFPNDGVTWGILESKLRHRAQRPERTFQRAFRHGQRGSWKGTSAAVARFMEALRGPNL